MNFHASEVKGLFLFVANRVVHCGRLFMLLHLMGLCSHIGLCSRMGLCSHMGFCSLNGRNSCDSLDVLGSLLGSKASHSFLETQRRGDIASVRVIGLIILHLRESLGKDELLVGLRWCFRCTDLNGSLLKE
mmetsp:Transcript_18118/g.21290  ORF Transcript_18118/g.21290 Transcript_18118/m.21290 type:complete len:131 (+) Transcript_18118:181-573(+)